MSRLGIITGTVWRRPKQRLFGKPRTYHAKHELRAARQLVGRDLARDGLGRRIPIWLIPGIAVGAVCAALAIVHVRVALIGQGYKRYSAIERLQALEEEKRILTAQVRELRDPARLAELARGMGLSRPDRVIALAPPGVNLAVFDAGSNLSAIASTGDDGNHGGLASARERAMEAGQFGIAFGGVDE